MSGGKTNAAVSAIAGVPHDLGLGTEGQPRRLPLSDKWQPDAQHARRLGGEHMAEPWERGLATLQAYAEQKGQATSLHLVTSLQRTRQARRLDWLAAQSLEA
jgi:hypothetical protein